MAPDPARPLPSDAELKVLRELWLHGESTVREIHERVSDGWPVGYTTVLKLLQRMLDKGLVERNEEGRAHRYRAAASRERTQRRLARDLVEKAFGGSIGELVRAALPPGDAREEELEEIRKALRRRSE
ncbi:MAG: BlaI/MecI/CopY family transcriptional regulator [Gemmatimonadota bacterium]|nr:BlaI/MecI/CopY family transcriptional regulator [Gemmatimonadota bacterium]